MSPDERAAVRAEAFAEATQIARDVAAGRRIAGQILDVEAAQARRAGEYEMGSSLRARAWFRKDEETGAEMVAHRLLRAAAYAERGLTT